MPSYKQRAVRKSYCKNQWDGLNKHLRVQKKQTLYMTLRNVLKYIGTLVFGSFEYVARCNKYAKHEIR
jgi:hypothetical protein